MAVCLHDGGANSHAHGRFSGGPWVQRSPPPDVHDLAEAAADEVAFPVPLLDKALALEDREGTSQSCRTDLVSVGEVCFRRQAFTRFDRAGCNLAPEIVGDVVMA
ncbi:hypothetical protein GCM10010300_04720 [Streptomyces olivaceoviridis]|nr:hypothetical protein GCM10010300_04720 [Streptomyces olivaceoviridis]